MAPIYKIFLDGLEVARLSGAPEIGFGQKTNADGKQVCDTKMISLKHHGQTVFVLMASSQANVTVERECGE